MIDRPVRPTISDRVEYKSPPTPNDDVNQMYSLSVYPHPDNKNYLVLKIDDPNNGPASMVLGAPEVLNLMTHLRAWYSDDTKATYRTPPGGEQLR
jgi:hypothetical protein